MDFFADITVDWEEQVFVQTQAFEMGHSRSLFFKFVYPLREQQVIAND